MLPWTNRDIQEGEHITSFEHDWCWCQPRVEHMLPDGEVTIHRHFWDRPEYGGEED